MKSMIIFLVIAIILTGMVYTNITNNIQHNTFIDEMMTFKNQGGRNTSEMGFELCKRLNEIEGDLYIDSTDCEAIYK